MKNTIIFTIILIFTFCFTATAQTDEAARRVQLIQALERSQSEVLASRDLIGALKEQVESKEKLINSLNKKDELSQSAIKSLQYEIDSLRAAIDDAKKIMEIREKEVDILKKELDKTRKKLSRSRSISKYLAVIAGVLAAVIIAK